MAGISFKVPAGAGPMKDPGGFVGATGPIGTTGTVILTGRCPCCGAPTLADEIIVDPVTFMVARNGKLAVLSRMEFRYFEALRAQRGNGIVPQRQIFDAVYGDRKRGQKLPELDVLKVMSSKIRKKLAPLGLGVATAWGVGAMLSTTPGVAALPVTRVRGFNWSDEKTAELKRMHREKVPFLEQAARLSVSIQTLSRKTAEAGLELRA